jgi:hypothetical protein
MLKPANFPKRSSRRGARSNYRKDRIEPILFLKFELDSRFTRQAAPSASADQLAEKASAFFFDIGARR